ncbi:MAG: nucleotidyltransferase family protein [Sphingomicrobium sp.]
MSAVPATAMVMAAGLGKRMRPLTDHRPKPLVKLAGKPLIDHVLDRLRAAGVGRVVVNVHYFPEQVEAHLAANAAGLDVVISDERSLLLETGGGLVRALPLIDTDPFLVVNSDNFWTDGDGDALRKLAAAWDGAAMDALLLLIPRARAGNHHGSGDFNLDAAGRVSRGADGADYIFTGIQIIAKRLLRDAPDGPFSTNLLWDRAIDEGRAFGAIHDGCWFDVGTPAAIAATEAMLTSA